MCAKGMQRLCISSSSPISGISCKCGSFVKRHDDLVRVWTNTNAIHEQNTNHFGLA